MAKGKKKTLIIERRLENPCKNKAEKETKENNEMKKTCQEQQTLHTFMTPSNPRSPHRNNPLFPIHEENSSTCTATNTRKHGEASLTVELHLTKDNSDPHTSPFGPKEKTVSVPEDDGTPHAAFSNKSEHRNHTKAKVPRPTQKKSESKIQQHNRKVTDYYPIRRSSRKSKAELEYEEQQRIDDLITNNVEDGLKVKYIEGKGRGVFADREFHKGQFVVEYHGDLLKIDDAKKREAQYAQDPTKGCYMYYFRYLNNSYWSSVADRLPVLSSNLFSFGGQAFFVPPPPVDATTETGRLGRLINHRKNGNCQTKVHDINGIPHLILVASRDIKVEEELLYDYGDRSKEAIAAHPWLKD
ncbi:lysine methyltransferase 5Ab isoform X2 [Electrophorus electricus]|uniref:lysine methyltransferase 5Ab isoform X2 n=1 Tax=Electrophorus electricus TaxID=8005 RepID=UPI0015D0A7D0|nr:lysine methyltransferase 5Ab isoform X2 [Electrophorus electricus]